MDDRSRILELYRLAHAFAAVLHSQTLSGPGWPGGEASNLRKQSRLLTVGISEAAHGSGSPERSISSLHQAETILLDLLDRLGSEEFASSPRTLEIRSLQSEGILLLQRINSALDELARSDLSRSATLAPAGSEKSTTSPALEGRTILVTRPIHQSGDLKDRILSSGGYPVVVPMIEIQEPDSWDTTDREIRDLQSYLGVIFTSRNAVEAFVGRLADRFPAARSILGARIIFAVGEKTKQALENAQIPVTLIPETSSATELAKHILEVSKPGDRYLFPKGSLSREELPRVLRGSHAVVNEVVVYQTIAPNPGRFAALIAAMHEGEIDAVTFFSPSSVRNFFDFMGDEIVWNTLCACVGPSTAAEATRMGFREVLTSSHASAEGVVHTLVDYFAHHSRTRAGGV